MNLRSTIQAQGWAFPRRSSARVRGVSRGPETVNSNSLATAPLPARSTSTAAHFLMVGPGGSAHPTALGANTTPTPRDININGGTFNVIGGDYDASATTMQYNIGPAGGTIRSTLGSQIIINDGSTTGLTPTQLRGSGDLTFTGGGRYALNGNTPQSRASRGIRRSMAASSLPGMRMHSADAGSRRSRSNRAARSSTTPASVRV